MSLLFVIFSCAYGQEHKAYVIKSDDKKLVKQSANSLKEMIGEIARDVAKRSITLSKKIGQLHVMVASKDHSATLHNVLGKWQVELADVQSRCVEVLEKLLENQKPFKKASKQDLQAAYKCMEEAKKTLDRYIVQLTDEHAQVASISLGKEFEVFTKTSTVLQSGVVAIKQIQQLFNNDLCLKIT